MPEPVPTNERLRELLDTWAALAEAAEKRADAAVSPEVSIGSLAAMATYHKCRSDLAAILGPQGGPDDKA